MMTAWLQRRSAMQGMLISSRPLCNFCVAQVPDVNDKRYQPGPPAEGEEEAVRLPSQVHEHSQQLCGCAAAV